MKKEEQCLMVMVQNISKIIEKQKRVLIEFWVHNIDCIRSKNKDQNTNIVEQNMEGSSSKVEAMRPLLIKAGIPLAVSLAGFVIVRITKWKSSPPMASSRPSGGQVDNQETDDQESFHSLDHTYDEACDCPSNALESSVVQKSCELQEVILGLKSRIEEMQEKEWQLEKRFLSYQELKDQEIVLMELQNKLVLEMNRVEVLGREISLLEEENKRFDKTALEYLNVLRLLEFSRSENEKLNKRVKKLLRTNREHFRISKKQSLLIQFKETEISECKKELEMKDDCIRALKVINERLQGEKNEISCKLRAAEESAISKVQEGETGNVENDNKLASEQERVQKDEAAEARELIYLRWSNACLRHELMRRSQQQQQQIEENNQMENSFDGFGSDNELNRRAGSYLGFRNRNNAHSRRRKLVAKFKRWVEGGEKIKHSLDDKLEKHGNTCFKGRSDFDGAEEECVPARKSCSSA